MILRGFSVEKEVLEFGQLFVYEELKKLQPDYQLKLHEVISNVGKFEYISMECFDGCTQSYGIVFDKMELKVMYPVNQGMPICMSKVFKTFKLGEYLEVHKLIIKMMNREIWIDNFQFDENDSLEESIEEILEKESKEIIKVLEKNGMKYFKHKFDKYNDEIIVNTGMNKILVKCDEVILFGENEKKKMRIFREEYFLIPILLKNLR
ncbi:MAG: hypothetical protein ACRDBY_01940 [Cetobacterium sp.]